MAGYTPESQLPAVTDPTQEASAIQLLKGLLKQLQAGTFLQQQLTEANASGGTLTFAATVVYVEIVNTDATNAGLFNVNNIVIKVPPKGTYRNPVGGTPRATVTVTGATSYIVSRYT